MMAALLHMHRARESQLHGIHISACWTSFGRLAKQGLAKRCWLQANAEVLELLLQSTVRAAGMGKLGARELANVAYGAACGGMGRHGAAWSGMVRHGAAWSCNVMRARA